MPAMLRRLAQCAFYLLLLVSGEEFEGVVVDARCSAQYAGLLHDPQLDQGRVQCLRWSSCSRNRSTTG